MTLHSLGNLHSNPRPNDRSGARDEQWDALRPLILEDSIQHLPKAAEDADEQRRKAAESLQEAVKRVMCDKACEACNSDGRRLQQTDHNTQVLYATVNFLIPVEVPIFPCTECWSKCTARPTEVGCMPGIPEHYNLNLCASGSAADPGAKPV